MNPLQSRAFLIPFDQIKPEHVEPAVRATLAGAEAELQALIDLPGERSYANTVQPLDDLLERLNRVVKIAHHLTAVISSPELRVAYNAVLPEFSAFFARLPLNAGLWQALQRYAATAEAQQLTGVRWRHLDKTLREFRRAGADLPAAQKARVEELRIWLAKLQTKFSENVLDATNAFELVITEEAELAGLPESARAQAQASAESKGLTGWRFTLQQPSLLPFLQYAEARELRRQLYTAHVNRASAGEYDNRPLLAEILSLRRELAGLLGYRDYADYALEEGMVKSGSAALAFVRDLTERTVPYFRQEIAELTALADTLGLKPMAPWDLLYVIEKLRKAKYDLDEEELRPYFPLPQVLAGLFEITRRLFGIKVTERPITQVWHPEVKFYDIVDEAGTHLGSFYADWFPRESKRAGAWMNAFITGGPSLAGFAPHLGLMVGNFTPPRREADGREIPALLTHREVETTFHEFGHLLHHCLSQVEVPARAGTNVPRDWVELPSQIMENWCWERAALALFARHYQTGEPIPEALFTKLQRARRYAGAYQQMRQLSFGTVDLALHILYDPAVDGDVVSYAQRLMEPFNVRPEFAHNHFLTAFTHVFAGGYAASYYSYKWSEVLDADAFTRFQREGLLSRQTGQAYLESILSRGDSADPATLYREFMGRDPELGPLLARTFGADDPKRVSTS